MAEVSDNDLTDGLRGRLGKKIVFRKLGNRTIASRTPRKPAVQSENQVKQRARFLEAVRYAKKSLLTPSNKVSYMLMATETGAQSAYAAAVGDYLKPPVIKSISLDAYNGKVGDVVSVEVSILTKIVTMQITITAPDGTVIETGSAVRPPGVNQFDYTITHEHAAPPGTKVKVVATDKPGHSTTSEIVK